MAKFTLHNRFGMYMLEKAKTLEIAVLKCDAKSYKCIVYEAVYAMSPWDKTKITKQVKEVYRNY